MTYEERLRVLVVDDSAMYRKLIQEILEELPEIEVVGTALNGKVALAKVNLLQPDVLTLDVEMPEMDGLDVLRRLRNDAPDVGAIMLSSYTSEGAIATIKALELGAFDFIPKPQSGDLKENKRILKENLASMLQAFSRTLRIRQILKQGRIAERREGVPQKTRLKAKPALKNGRGGLFRKSEVVAIGVSTGGPAALTQVISHIPGNIGVPILIVQHMPPMFTEAFARRLDSISPLDVIEGKDGDMVRPNTIYIAPGGKQMKVSINKTTNEKVIRVTDDPPENNCKPSIDYLFRSIAEHYGPLSTGVIMTGMGSDGTEGLRLMKAKGATIIAQDEATSTVYSMPRKPVEVGIVDMVVPLDSMAEKICSTVA